MKKLLNKRVIASVLALVSVVAVTLGAPDAVVQVLQVIIDSLQPVAQ